MDNKTILELIKKNLEEINLLVDDLYKGMKYDQVLIEITIAKAKILYQELSLITPEVNSAIPSFIDDESDEEVGITTEVIEVDQDHTEEVVIQVNIPEQPIEVPEQPIDLPKEPIFVPEEPQVISEQPVVTEQIVSEIEAKIITETPEEIINQIPEELIHITVEESEQSIDLPDTDKLIDKVIEVIPDSNEKKVFGEKFSKEPSLNDRLSALHSNEPKIKAKHIDSIKSAIGLNDRFLFTKELFNNDSSEFDTSINKLDNMNSFLEVIEFLEQNYKWTKNTTSLKFMDLVKRKFEN